MSGLLPDVLCKRRGHKRLTLLLVIMSLVVYAMLFHIGQEEAVRNFFALKFLVKPDVATHKLIGAYTSLTERGQLNYVRII